MRELEFATPALRDLEKIRIESEAGWGLAQRQRYTGAIEARLDQLLERPELGAIYGESRPGPRRLRSGLHIIFYRFDDERVRVLRVLHEAMDVSSHLAASDP